MLPRVSGPLLAIAHATQRLELGTGVTCPTMRIHPAIIAHAAATVAAMMPGRFFLGVGTGEATAYGCDLTAGYVEENAAYYSS